MPRKLQVYSQTNSERRVGPIYNSMVTSDLENCSQISSFNVEHQLYPLKFAVWCKTALEKITLSHFSENYLVAVNVNGIRYWKLFKKNFKAKDKEQAIDGITTR